MGEKNQNKYDNESLIHETLHRKDLFNTSDNSAKRQQNKRQNNK